MNLHHTSDIDCPLCEFKLSTAHHILQDWFKTKVKPKFPDAHISWAWRGEEDQEKCFQDGKTKLHWPNSPHNKMSDEKPMAHALDLFQIDENHQGLWSPGFFFKLSEMIKADGDPIFWGGEYKTFGDADHFGLKDEDASI